MRVEYKIDPDDFLTHQLFVASRSERIRKKRERNKLIVPLIYIVLAVLSALDGRYSMAIGFIIVGLLWLILYPLWEKRHYVNHYRSFINENYKDRFDKLAVLEINDDYFFAKDDGSESKVSTSEIEEINDIPSTLLIRLKGGQSFILPKNKITDIDNLARRLKELAGHLAVTYTIDETWEWK